ncbi:purine-nucleoside phosphorylase [Zavarzinella formosa]|uniref:purine-nucleoside phosphorylase n=1 Tax=Zavarzinella formosa TaxID=360055 RepID=UPI00030B629C|nr:purine-nucleoside phosphorylase [Zavarzinella formosa]
MSESRFGEFEEAVRRLQPTVAVVLGSGLGAVPHGFAEAAAVEFGDVPGMVAPTVAGHSGTIRVGALNGTPLLVFRGRLHFYEGHAWEQVAKPVELAAGWGIRTLILTNAAGGIHPELNPGDLMVLSDHRFWQRIDSWKETPPPSPYDPELIQTVVANEARRGRKLLAGIYTALTGPCYETPAEIRALQQCGFDAVGMSTAFEALTARRLGMRVLAISSITNKAAGLSDGPLNHEEVLANATRPAERMSEILGDLLGKWPIPE